MMSTVIASSVYRVVVGLGVTGLSCARYLHARGERFSVFDTRQSPPGLEQLQREMPEVDVYLGTAPAGLLQGAEELVVSPGIALDAPLLTDIGSVPVIGDIDLFVREAQAPVVGITGSNAKSTVTELVGRMAARAGLRAGVGGNLGTPALELLDADRELYVLELSSFQLERAGELRLAVATVLNISADHLDRHGDMPSYHRAKHRIFRGCKRVVVNADDPLTQPLIDSRVLVVSWRNGEPELDGYGVRILDGAAWLCRGFEPLLATAELGLAGRHNIANALAALSIAEAAGLDRAAAVAELREFSGLPHRCQAVATVGGVSYVDDSKGTNVGAALAAIEGFGGDHNLLLIAGGRGKGADFRSLRPAVGQHCRLLLVLGEAAEELEAALGDVVPTRRVASMEDAVQAASATAVAGDCVLLSPACASFDMFSGYVERGERFAAAVARLAEERT